MASDSIEINKLKENSRLLFLKDLLLLSKPRITLMSVLMALGGFYLSNAEFSASVLMYSMLGVALIVASANTLNMYLERDTDSLMKRTSKRPLPDKRLSSKTALIFGVVLGVLSLLILYFFVNRITTLLAGIALVLYVWVYTPLKYKSPIALFIGAVPGAFPPLLGWTSATGKVSEPGLVLFLILFLWQIPHFLAIALIRKDEYQFAGIKALPTIKKESIIKSQIFIYSIIMIPVSLLLLYFRVSGLFYGVVSFAVGVWFSKEAYSGMQTKDGDFSKVKKVYYGSLIYLPVIIFALILDITLFH
ncbi:MAG: heme o synthase [Leptospiraceae bacterium]|nr:protoheme IX farnesyltransferase [Leptospiraceae bacterium]MCK6381714.1 heme o synthase [Leptospiraceae bacterium]NUM42935.1 protoheme IX farnesyltransferase [Leptospiraceae bacterium]